MKKEKEITVLVKTDYDTLKENLKKMRFKLKNNM